MRKKLLTELILPGVLFSLLLFSYNPSFAQGGLDPSFGNGGKVITNVGFGATSEYINDIALQADGKIVAVGYILPLYPNSLHSEFIVARYNPDGSLDAGFGNGGIVRTDFSTTEYNADGIATDVKILSDGSILVGGAVTGNPDNTGKLALVRYQPNGDLQTGFGSGGIVFIGTQSSNYIDPSFAMQGEKIVVFGEVNGQNTVRIFRVNADGSADATFGVNGETQITSGNFLTLQAIAIQSDNKILIAGTDLLFANSSTDFVLYKLSVDGQIEGKVITDIAGENDQINSLAIQPDGKIVAVGMSGFDFAVARYNIDGSLDDSFDTDGKQVTSFSASYSFPADFAIQPDGKIVVVGYGDPGSLLDTELEAARYLPNGQLDPCFGIGGKLTYNFFPNKYETFTSLAIQADGKILFGGSGFSISSNNDLVLIRYISPEAVNWYLDADGDGYGDDDNTVVSCTDPSTQEIQCLLIIDPNCTTQPIETCPQIPDPSCTPTPAVKYVTIGGDCNDNNSAINPGATEVCDGIDNDCDGQIDEGLSTQTWYVDYDNDGYGATASAVVSCNAPDAFWKITGGDCDDNNSAINPGETEVCDGIDNDCDGQIDEGLPTQTWYVDYDNDGYGVTASAVVSCKAPDAFWKTTGGDCDDNNSAIHPGANGGIELCDGIDNDCDGLIDEGCSGKPTVSISDATVYESEGKAVLTIRLSHITTLQVKINYATSDGTAVSNKKEKDYKAIGNTMLTIPPGTLTTTITVPIYSDNKTENNEYFYINLTKPTNCLLGDVSGMITILDGGPANVAARSSEADTEPQSLQIESMDVSAYPNPTHTNFRLKITTADQQERMFVKVYDAKGSLVETRNNISPNTIIQFGDNYRPGIYLIQVIQGKQHKQLKLVKVN